MDKCYLGIDTSNYTTSMCVFNATKKTYISKRKLLDVKEGELGLRQSDAVFQHIKNLPDITDSLFFEYMGEIRAYGASEKPTNQKNSYMPCFRVGSGLANTMGVVENKPYYFFTHQQGHIMAALFSIDRLDLVTKRFIAFHVSGGTTDAVLCSSEKDIMNTEPLSTSKDLHAGQLIDRVGLMLGLTFPCGKEVEALSHRCREIIKLKATMKGSDCCLSGFENKASDLLKKKQSAEYVAKYVLTAVAESIVSMINAFPEDYDGLPIVFSGGVMSNLYIRRYIKKNTQRETLFCEPELSTDNAVGIAVLTAIKDLKNGNTKHFDSISD